MDIEKWGIGFGVGERNAILDVYVKYGAINYATRFRVSLNDRDTVTWNIMMGAYMHIGDMEKLFRRLPSKYVSSLNTVVYRLMQNGMKDVHWSYLMRWWETEFCFKVSLSL